MAKVQISDDYVDIHVGLLERLRFAEKSRRVPLLHIRGVDAYSPAVARFTADWDTSRLDDDEGQTPERASSRPPRGHDPAHWLTLDLCDEDIDRLLVDVDDESPSVVADRIRHAVAAAQTRAIEQMRERSERREILPLPPSVPPPPPDLDLLSSDWEDPTLPRHITPLPRAYSIPPPVTTGAIALSVLSRAGGVLLGVGTLGMLAGAFVVASGAVTGLVAIGAGIACTTLGGLALALSLREA